MLNVSNTGGRGFVTLEFPPLCFNQRFRLWRAPEKRRSAPMAKAWPAPL